jgi:hypothetical protein
MSSLRHFLGSVTQKILLHPFGDRVAGYIAWQRRRKTRRLVEAALREAGVYPNVVQAGPFTGMKLPPPDAFLDARFEKTFGAYEHELFGLITGIASDPSSVDTIVNIGAADGFYTVGLARLFPLARVVGYEPNPVKTPVLRAMAELNHVAERIELHGACTPEILRDLEPAGKVLVVIDVDGYEKEVLDPARVPWLSHASVLVETHDCFVPEITALLKQRFALTHEVTEIGMSGPDLSSIPPLQGLTMHQVDALTGSERPSLQGWLYLRSTRP